MTTPKLPTTTDNATPKVAPTPTPAEEEIGGQGGPEPTRFGDWERNGRCTDF